MARDCFYITTPIYYVNAVPHIGNAYTTVACDVLARFHRQLGEDVVFSTGTDEHALKVLEVANEAGLHPLAYADNMEPKFKEQWTALGIQYDEYIRTPEKRHVELVEKVFQQLMDQGDIYLGSYEGWYCVSDETFFTKSEVSDEKCPNPECRRPLEWVREENYFFRLSGYQDRLLDYMTANPGWLRPEYRANEVVAFTRSGLKDQSVSRVNRGWGIPVPGDDSHVVYVWFDALLNYLTVAGYLSDDARFDRVWPPSVQLMGKDIFVRFHCTLWPAMLMALGVELPEMLVGHGFWTVEGEKIAKRSGNVVYATDLVQELSELSGCASEVAADAIRYFLLRQVPFGLDGDFSKTALVTRFNKELANDLGNLLNRAISMLHKWFGGQVPQVGQIDDDLAGTAARVEGAVREALQNVDYSRALDAAWELVSAGNRYIEKSAPWALHREGKEAELAQVLYNALETARVVTVLLAPWMPVATERMWKQIGLSGSPAEQVWQQAVRYGSLPAGTRAGNADPIFPRIDIKKQEALTKVSEPATETQDRSPEQELVSFDQFRKMDIRIATVVTADKVEGADKLLKLTVDAGDAQPRQIVAGIAQFYSPEELPGRKIVLLANLAPARIRGIESQGMLLAADVNGRPVLLQPDGVCDVPSGAGVR